MGRVSSVQVVPAALLRRRFRWPCILGKYAIPVKVRSHVRNWWWRSVRLNWRRSQLAVGGVGGPHIRVIEPCVHFAGMSVNRKSPFALHDPGRNIGSDPDFGQYRSLLDPVCNRHMLNDWIVFKSKRVPPVAVRPRVRDPSIANHFHKSGNRDGRERCGTQGGNCDRAGLPCAAYSFHLPVRSEASGASAASTLVE